MKTQTLSIVVLILLMIGMFYFAKNNPIQYISKFVKTVQNNVNESQNTNLIATSTASGRGLTMCAEKNGVWYPNEKVCEVNQFSESECKAQGGEFNNCASACRHDPTAQACTMQCVLTCTFK